MTQSTIDSELDEILNELVRNARKPLTSPRNYIVEAAHTITNLIAQEANKAVATELKLLLDAQVIKPEYHNTVVMKYSELTEKGSNNG